jgi:hypothetical protein
MRIMKLGLLRVRVKGEGDGGHGGPTRRGLQSLACQSTRQCEEAEAPVLKGLEFGCMCMVDMDETMVCKYIISGGSM